MLSPMSDAALPAAGGPPLTLRDGTVVVLRPEVPADEALVAAFHAALSPRSVYQRYFHIATLDERSGPPRPATGSAVDPGQGAALVLVRP